MKPSKLLVVEMIGAGAAIITGVIESVIAIKQFKDRDRLNIEHAKECGKTIAETSEKIKDEKSKRQS